MIFMIHFYLTPVQPLALRFAICERSDILQAMRRMILLLLFLGVVSVGTVGPAAAGDAPPEADLALARRFAPVLYFHPDELFRPQPVEVLLEQARLRQTRTGWFDVNVLNQPTLRDLCRYRGPEYFLDVWYGDEGTSSYKNYSAHRAYYEAHLSPEAGGPPSTAYARVVREGSHITVQYWLFYYYNDWLNKHEGDWEMVQVILDEAEQPQWVVVSQHHGGTRRPWTAVQVEEETHPVIYVALGSHANYLWGNEVFPNVREMGSTSFTVVDRTGRAHRTVPQVLLVPEREVVEQNPDAWPGMEWLCFAGNWGERAAQADLAGPHGPPEKESWATPYTWGMEQPRDEAVWYNHRLRVTVGADGPVRVEGRTESGDLDWVPRPDGGGGTLLLHEEPTAPISFTVEALTATQVTITTTYPFRELGVVRQIAYSSIPLQPGQRLVGRLCTSCGPGLRRVEAGGEERITSVPYTEVVKPAVWDAPDVVWLAGLLPAEEISRGISTSLLAGVLPTLLYVLLLYWADRYEKEPKRLLATAFVWGALPAILLTVVVQFAFRLPLTLGARAVEATGAGWLAPWIEELLKGAVVLFIFLRYPREFDGVVDGVLYGGMTGFGFAMTGNTIGYLGAFLLQGWVGLGPRLFVQGLLHSLNHALYSAAFGAGLGWIRAMPLRRYRWAPAPAGFFLAGIIHTGHVLALRMVWGATAVGVLITVAGLAGMVALLTGMLARQRWVLRTELLGEVPWSLYRTMVLPGGRAHAQWRTLWREGIRGWLRIRQLHQRCAELAFKRRRARRRPDDADLAAEIERLRAEIQSAIASSSPR